MLVLAVFVLAEPAARAEEPVPIAVETADGPCPDAAPFDEALARRGFVADADAPFRLAIAAASDGVRATLADRAGASLLDRTVPAGDCAAVADTVALLVERRLEGVSWEAPPVEPLPADDPPPARETPRRQAPIGRRRPDLALGAGVLFATGFARDAGSAGPVLSVALHPLAPVIVGVDVGRLRHETTVATGTLVVDRYPLSLHAGWARRRPELELAVEARLEIETLAARTHGIAVPDAATRASIRVGPGVAVATEIAAPLWLVLEGAVLDVVSGWRFVVHDAEGARTTAARQVLAVEIGASVAWRLPL